MSLLDKISLGPHLRLARSMDLPSVVAPNVHASDSAASRPLKNVAVLGATGSIGTATVEVLKHLHQVDQRHDWRLWAASGHQNLDLLQKIAKDAVHPPERLIASCPDTVRGKKITSSGTPYQIHTGPDALIDAAAAPEVDILVASIVGRAGLESTLAAVDAGKRIALANKETLVVAGPLVRRRCEASGAELLPVDSEHSALFQCMGSQPEDVRRLILTASGGPFRTWSSQQMQEATPAAALNHPTWNMGAKITIDSATMMNKALEIIEARWLFDIPAERIEVVVHPQSIVHSLVEFNDHSVLSQWSPPDMRLPIQYALTYPRRLAGIAKRWDRSKPSMLELEPADFERFPALELGFEVATAGGTAGAVINAANEIAVGLFLNEQIRFTDIVSISRKVLENHTHEAEPTLERLISLDRWARDEAERIGKNP